MVFSVGGFASSWWVSPAFLSTLKGVSVSYVRLTIRHVFGAGIMSRLSWRTYEYIGVGVWRAQIGCPLVLVCVALKMESMESPLGGVAVDFNHLYVDPYHLRGGFSLSIFFCSCLPACRHCRCGQKTLQTYLLPMQYTTYGTIHFFFACCVYCCR